MPSEPIRPGAGELLWSPPAEARERTGIGRYMRWLQTQRGLTFSDYEQLWRWSVTDLEGFWSSIWDYFDVKAHVLPVDRAEHPYDAGSTLVRGSDINYAEHALRDGAPTKS